MDATPDPLKATTRRGVLAMVVGAACVLMAWLDWFPGRGITLAAWVLGVGALLFGLAMVVFRRTIVRNTQG